MTSSLKRRRRRHGRSKRRFGRAWSPLPIGKSTILNGHKIVRAAGGFVIYDPRGHYRGTAGNWLEAVQMTRSS